MTAKTAATIIMSKCYFYNNIARKLIQNALILSVYFLFTDTDLAPTNIIFLQRLVSSLSTDGKKEFFLEKRFKILALWC